MPNAAYPLGLLIAIGVGVAVMGVLFISVVGIVLVTGKNNRDVAQTPERNLSSPNPVSQAPAASQATKTNSKPGNSASAVLSTEHVVAKAEPSVAFIQGRSGIGTGFLIRPGIVATNRHVIEGELIDQIKVHFPSANTAHPFPAELLFVDPDRDLAFLSVSTSLPLLELAPEEAFRRGQEVIAIGNPGLGGVEVLQNAVSRGLLSTKIILDGNEFYQLNISINPGNSGGPVLNSAGQVIGVVTLKAKKEEGVAFCIPVQQLKNSLAAQGQLSAQEIAAVRSQHRLRVVFSRVNEAGMVYATGMKRYTEAMEFASEKGIDVNVGLNVVKEDLERQLTEYDQKMLGDLKREIAKITADTHISEGIRQQFVEMWSNYSELKSYVDRPRGNLGSYKMKFTQLAGEHLRLSESLKLLLGVE
jgi:S1-C subfamily serine protease